MAEDTVEELKVNPKVKEAQDKIKQARETTAKARKETARGRERLADEVAKQKKVAKKKPPAEVKIVG